MPWVMGLAVAHLSHNSSRAKQPRSLLCSASIILLVLLLMPCMNTTTAATRFLPPLHATLFLALHRPAFTLFVVVVLLQYHNDSWQRGNEAAWYNRNSYTAIILPVVSHRCFRPAVCSMFKRLSESSYAFMVLHPVRLGRPHRTTCALLLSNACLTRSSWVACLLLWTSTTTGIVLLP
jgi:hypothetical protein